MSLEELPANLIEKARKELNEDPETRIHIIDELRERIKERPDLRCDTTNKDLIRFLRARKFDVERAFELLIKHQEIKRDLPELFDNFSPSAERDTFESGWNIGFPERDQNGCKIFAFRPGKWDPTKRELINNLRANIIALEILLQEEETQINGVVMIGDFREFGFAQAKSLNPLTFRNYGSIIFNCYPMRIKGIHILDQPKVFSVIFVIVQSFMKQKVRDRVRLHGSNIGGILEYIDKDRLPLDYCGNLPATDLRTWVKQVMNAEEELEHLWL